MAEGSFLKKKFGPLSGGAWLAVTGGVLGSWLLIRRYEAARAAAAANTAASTTAGNTIPAGQSAAAGSGTAAGPQTLEAWTQDALRFGHDPIASLNAVQNWLSGNCVDHAGYVTIGRAIGALGLPPEMPSFPVLTVCPGATPPPAPTPIPTPSPTPPPPGVVVRPPPIIRPIVIPDPTLAVGVQPNGGAADVALQLRDLTLIQQAKQAGTTDPNAFWANFGALALDLQNNPAVQQQIVADSKNLQPIA